MKTVILAGGMGTRIAEESRLRPKPMVEIGGMPILWHIMREYSHFGHRDFIICAGYKQEYIKRWFAEYFMNCADVTFDFKDDGCDVSYRHCKHEPWRVTVVDTGMHTMTGGRIKRVREYLDDEPFFMTYGDGVCDVDINRLLDFHRGHGKLATLTTVKLAQDKGVLNIGGDNAVKSFREKNINDGALINAGYMVLEPAVLDYIAGDDTIFEKEPMHRLVEDGQLMSYHHKGFWQCMDNLREKEMLESLLAAGRAPWIHY